MERVLILPHAGMSTVTNERRVKAHLKAFWGSNEYPTLGDDLPLVYEDGNLKVISGYKQYAKGTLDAISQEVEERFASKMQEASELAGERGLVNDKVVEKLNLYSFDTE